MGNIDNFWLITKLRFYTNFEPKKVDNKMGGFSDFFLQVDVSKYSYVRVHLLALQNAKQLKKYCP